MLIKELFADALSYEESFLAHALYSGLRSGSLSGEQPAGQDVFERIDLDDAYKLHQQNLLGIQSNKLYSVPLGNSLFAMFFSEDEETVKKLFRKEFRTECKKAHLVDYGMDISTYDLETKEHQTWRELRSSLPVLPAYVGIFQK